MNKNKNQPARTTTESYMIHAASEWNTEHLQCINTPMSHLPLLTELNMIDALSVIQQDQMTLAGEKAAAARQASDQRFQPSCQQHLHGHYYGRGGSEESDRQNYGQQSTLDDITETVDDEHNQTFLEMYDLEKFYADERLKKEQLTESEQIRLLEQLQSLIKDAPKSSYLHPTRKLHELEYYNLLKLLELIQDDLDQSENIEIVSRIIGEEQEEEEEEEQEEHQHLF